MKTYDRKRNALASKALEKAKGGKKYSGKVSTYNDGSGVSKEIKAVNPKKYGLNWLKGK